MDHSRRPKHSPTRTRREVEQAILAVREKYPAWGGRKIKARLENLGHTNIPSASTITAILKRNGQIDEHESQKHKAYKRFEMDLPNQLWQMDFKGNFSLQKGGYCHPLTILDDHSRFLIGLVACKNERADTVKSCLIDAFRNYGLPDRMLMDNGPPWGFDAKTPHTILTAWLLQLGIHVCHGRPYHPQTQGKDERLYRTLKAELLSQSSFTDLRDCQRSFGAWRKVYNCERPHEALHLNVPDDSYYVPSPRPYPENLPPLLYEHDDIIRKVDATGKIYSRNQIFRVGKAFNHHSVAIRPTDIDGKFRVYFGVHLIESISLK